MASARFQILSRRVQQLRRRFIPKAFSPTGSYSERQRDHARAYRLLVHAEIEAYLEDRAREIALRAVQSFKANGRAKSIILNLVSFHSKHRPINAMKLKEIYSGKVNHVAEAIDSAMLSYTHTITNNHGIKQEDVLRLLLPLGFRLADLDSGLLATLDSFGANRGKVAHTSIKAQQLIDPKTETDTVDQMINGLITVDEKFTLLWREC
jgi:RiboL-PSP-HEPN